jgi:hypothetical protein
VKLSAIAFVRNACTFLNVDYKTFFIVVGHLSVKEEYIFSPLKQSITRLNVGSNDSTHVLL